MKILFTLIITLVSITAESQNKDNLKTKILDSSAMLTDFRYLRSLLQETHPGLYRYTSKNAMQANLDSCEALLHTTMPFYDFYRIVEGVIADIHCAHTYSLPVKDMENYFNKTMKTVPFFLFPLQGKVFVLLNCTPDTSVLPGFELININGRSITDIRETLRRYYWSDGFIQLPKDQVLQGQRFDIFYYSLIERPDSFNLIFKNLAGDSVHFTTSAQTFNSSVKWIKNNPVNKQMAEWYNKKKPKYPWRLRFPEDLKTAAILRFDGFNGQGQNTEEEARSAFRAFMDQSMTEIEQKQCTNLIVDVRSNSGGWDIQGVELFTYLMKSDTAVKYYQRQHTVTNASAFLKYSDASPKELKQVKDELKPESDGTFSLAEEKNPALQLQYPKPNRFKGKVYILMDEKTYSTAAEFTAAAHYNKLGTFVGEETPGAYDGGNGGTFIHLELPNSKIAIGTPLVYYQMNVGVTKVKGRGTIPDYQVSVTLDDLLQHKDSQLDFVKNLIRK